MEGLNVSDFYNVLLFICCILSIYSVLASHTKDSKTDSTQDGVMMADMSHIKQTLDKIENSVNKLDDKIEKRYSDTEAEFRQLLISNTELAQSYKSLHKRVDDLNDKLTALQTSVERSK